MFLKNKKIYIAGAGGMLGEAFFKHFSQFNKVMCTDKSPLDNWISELDFRNTENYHKDVKNFKPDYLFHLGALTSLEECELNKDNAYMTNYLAVEDACKIANDLNIPILYISTAGIFDGKKEIYYDWDLPNPLGVYASSKYQGELTVKEQANQSYIFRAGWMMGGGEKKDKKFIKKIVTQIKEGKNELNIVNDKFGTPTYTYDFAKNVDLVISKGFYGLYNLVCEGLTSREEVAREVLKIFSLENKININLVDSSFFKKEYFAPRPLSERLINQKLNLRNLNIMRDWKICLSEYLESGFEI